MDGSPSNKWHYADSRQQRPQPSFWEQAHNLPHVGTRHDHRAYQATVENTIDDSRTCYGPASSNPSERQPHVPDPYAWARGSGGVRAGVPLNSVRASTIVTSRRSFAEPLAPFSPPPLVPDSSTLSSSANFSATTPPFDRQLRRRSSQQAFPDHIDRDALARANKRMASAPDWPDLSDSPFHVEGYDPFAPLQPRAPFMPGSGLYAGQTQTFQQFDAQRESASSTHSSHRRNSQVKPQPQSPPAPAEDASAFKSYLNSELNRRNVADKTVLSIRSEKARAVAQAKENGRRIEWAKDILLKFPVQCALAESLRPEDMMAVIAASGVYELTTSMA